MKLTELGWNPRWEQAFESMYERHLEPARVVREDRGRYVVLNPSGARVAVVTGRFRHEVLRRAGFPAVGDWVAIQAPAGGDQATIHAVLPRSSAFMRKVAGETTEEQVVAANVDTLFLIVGLDGDYNLRRLERHLAAAWDSGAVPVVVLNKADLASDLEAAVAEAEAAAPGVAVAAVSARDRTGLDALSAWLAPGATVAMVGSSGVGKSTLVNALLGEERQAVNEVRASDARGRHTTTRRELLPLPGGALLIDTPGLREFQMWAGAADLGDAFPEIERLAKTCRFRDCRHDSEPGCALTDAVARGTLDPARLASWRKLQRELEWNATRNDQRLRSERDAKWRAISRSMKHHPKADRWRG